MTPERKREIETKLDKAMTSVTKDLNGHEILFVSECLEELADYIQTSLNNKGYKNE